MATFVDAPVIDLCWMPLSRSDPYRHDPLFLHFPFHFPSLQLVDEKKIDLIKLDSSSLPKGGGALELDTDSTKWFRPSTLKELLELKSAHHIT